MNKLAPAFGSIFLALVTVGAAEMVLTGQPRPERIMPAVAFEVEATQAPVAIATARPEAYYAAITERPLFAITRRPVLPQTEVPEPAPAPVAEPIPKPAQKPQFPDVTLNGILMSGNEPIALLALNGEAASWMRQGQKLDDWTVIKIADDHVEFQNNTEVARVNLYEKRAD